jgi:hypothetical protein
LRSEWLKFGPEENGDVDPLLPRLEQLWSESGTIWDENESHEDFKMFVAADYRLVYRTLLRYRDRINTFLEWGAGTGVTTIMASLLGLDAYGIEIEPGLITRARELNEKYQSKAVFVEGSFIPDSYDWNAVHADEHFRSRIDGPSGYDELDLELRDFDLIYAYPWPDEESLFHDIMRQCAAKNSLLLTYHVREGMKLTRRGR